MFEPSAVEEVAALDAKGYVLGGIVGGVLEAAFEFGRDALVGVEIEDPGMAKGDVFEAPVLVSGPVVEGAGGDVRAVLAGELEGAVGAEGIEDMDVVGPGYRLETAGEILFFIAG